MEVPIIKIFGERNTGTNYLNRLIELNLKVNLLSGSDPEFLRGVQKWLPGHELLLDLYSFFSFRWNLGWKHSFPDSDAINQSDFELDKLCFVTLTKNPYSWLLSLYKRPYHFKCKFNLIKNPYVWFISLFRRPYHYSVKKQTFEKFLLNNWLTVRRERAKRIICNPIELWNLKNKSYLYLSKSYGVLNLKYEDLISDPDGLILMMRDQFNIELMNSCLKNVIKSTKGDKKDFSYYKKYYLEELWKDELSNEAISIINQYLDERVINIFNYELIKQ